MELLISIKIFKYSMQKKQTLHSLIEILQRINTSFTKVVVNTLDSYCLCRTDTRCVVFSLKTFDDLMRHAERTGSFHLRRVVLRQKPFFKEPSNKNLYTVIQYTVEDEDITRI